jgi:hypothetical protein
LSSHSTQTPARLLVPTRTAPKVRTGWPTAATWKTFGSHILIPLFLAAGMALAYLGAFHQPTAHNFEVAIAGDTPQSMVFAQTLQNKSDGQLSVRTTADAASARSLVQHRTVAAAYITTATSAKLMVSTAAGGSTAQVAQTVFMPIAYQQHLPFQVKDVAPAGTGDPTGQGLFFLLVALSLGGYASAIVIASVTAKLRIAWRLAAAAVVAGAVATIGVVVAGPIYGVISGHDWSIGLLASLYVFGIISIGVGLHPLLGRWTTPALTMLFVMLNFTTSGGIFAPSLQSGFFAALHSFWNGAAWLDSAQTLSYFPGQVFGFDGLRLALWAMVGVGLTLITHYWSVRKTRVANDHAEVGAEEQELAAA